MRLNGVKAKRDLHLGWQRRDQISDGFRVGSSQYVKKMSKAETIAIIE